MAPADSANTAKAELVQAELVHDSDRPRAPASWLSPRTRRMEGRERLRWRALGIRTGAAAGDFIAAGARAIEAWMVILGVRVEEGHMARILRRMAQMLKWGLDTVQRWLAGRARVTREAGRN